MIQCSYGFNLEEHTAQLHTTTDHNYIQLQYTTITYNYIELPDSPKLHKSCVRTAKLRPRQMVCTTALTSTAHRAASATSSSCEACSKHPAAARVNLLLTDHCYSLLMSVNVLIRVVDCYLNSHFLICIYAI